MKKLSIFLITSLIFLNATTIGGLFQKIKKIPDSKIDDTVVKISTIKQKEIKGKLFPDITFFSSIKHFSMPTNMRPLPPTEAAKIGKSGGGYPFSQNIEKMGLKISMPLFIKNIYDTEDKLEHLITINKYKRKLNLLKRETLLVALVSKYNFLLKQKKALKKEKESIERTIKSIDIGVKVGKIPEFNELRLKASLTELDLKINNLDRKLEEIKDYIYKLTYYRLNNIVSININNNIIKKEFLLSKILKEKIKLKNYNIKLAKDNFYPKLLLNSTVYRAYGKSYDNNKHNYLNYGNIGIYLQWNIYNKTNIENIEEKKLDKLKANLELEKTIKDLTADVIKIEENIKKINKAIKLAKRNIEIKKELLESAKTAFKLQRMTVDDYLKYEDNLVFAKSTLANLIAIKNMLIANLAFIYGNNLEKVFK